MLFVLFPEVRGVLDLKLMAALKGDLSPSYETKPCCRAASSLAQQRSGFRTVKLIPHWPLILHLSSELTDWQAGDRGQEEVNMYKLAPVQYGYPKLKHSDK